MEQPNNTASSRRPRPCDACRRRKRRCVIEPGNTICQLCRATGLPQCSYNDADGSGESSSKKRPAADDFARPGDRGCQPATNGPSRSADVIEDYDSLREFSLLKQNLGLQQHRYLRHVGPSDELDVHIFDYCSFDDRDEYQLPSRASIRKVSANTQFTLTPYSHTREREVEFEQLDAIEQLVSPNGKHLVKLYFEFVHPSFPIIDQKTYIEKYERTHREFSPPCLAGVYLAALDWWHHDKFLSSQTKPDINAIESIARRALQSVIHRPKLSTLQGGLLLLQHRPTGEGTWAMSCQVVAVAQELGAHLDSSSWRIPTWEKSLRARLGWAVYCLDKWMALSNGRPSHIFDEEWALPGFDDTDESADDENDKSLAEPNPSTSFGHLTSLSTILSKILKLFYSTSTRRPSPIDPRPLLEAAKPVQIELKIWYQNLTEALHQDDHEKAAEKILPSLHLAYYATEVALHRAIQKTLTKRPCEALIYKFCRDAACERARKAVHLVKGLRISDLYGFWYASSGYSLISIGTFVALLLVTSRSLDEAKQHKSLLDDYRWTLRTMSGCLSHIQHAVERLDASLWHLEEITPEDIINRSSAPESTNGEMPEVQPTNGGAPTSTRIEHISSGDITGIPDNAKPDHAPKIVAPGPPVFVDAEINVANIGVSRMPTNQDLTWVDMAFASPDFADISQFSGQEQSDWQLQGMDFYGRDWHPPSETSEYWAFNRSLEDF